MAGKIHLNRSVSPIVEALSTIFEAAYESETGSEIIEIHLRTPLIKTWLDESERLSSAANGNQSDVYDHAEKFAQAALDGGVPVIERILVVEYGDLED